MSIRISLRLGGYRRIMPFLFSLPPRCQLEYGSAKHVSMPGSSRRRVWRANSVPLSCVTPTRAPAGGGDQPRPGHSATRAHRRPHDGRWRLRGLARLRTALRRAGSAMQHPPVHGPVLSRFGRHGRQDPFSSDGNPRVAFDLPADAGRAASQQTGHLPDARAVADLDLDDPAFPFRQARTYFSHRCNIPSDWLSGQSPI